MKSTAIILGMLGISLSSVAQSNTNHKIAFGLDYVPTQYDRKSEYWSDAEQKNIEEQGVGINASIGYALTSVDHISLAITKHRNTVETTYRDDDNLLYVALDVFDFFTTGNIASRDIKNYNQTVRSSSFTTAISYFNENQTNKRTFIGAELGIGVRTYVRDVHRTVSTHGVIAEEASDRIKEQVPNFKIMLRVRSKISPSSSIVGKIGIANTPITLGLQYNL